MAKQKATEAKIDVMAEPEVYGHGFVPCGDGRYLAVRGKLVDLEVLTPSRIESVSEQKWVVLPKIRVTPTGLQHVETDKNGVPLTERVLGYEPSGKVRRIGETKAGAIARVMGELRKEAFTAPPKRKGAA